ncbi:DUF5985 family protein [Noviherbaspirillum sp.]|uniref:DUF5985 family protein n=1 Tax=Noviherbaspirillum sp. TaxID=1926288 RepID=UPI002D4B8DA0|nr:DUF5985 family protein [Noviherbaspirillum sp.]HZW20340.1 DUF5985 family protein [Noviherbaspirillum sp.]
MAAVIYTLCALTALACAYLLLRSYVVSRHRLLLWSGLCFSGMFINNIILIVDRLFYTAGDLSTMRLVAALVALLPLLYGLVWEDE